MRDISGHVKCQAEIVGPDLRTALQHVRHAEETRFGILPVPNKTFKHRLETRTRQIAGLPSSQDEASNDGDREVKLLAIIPPTALDIRPTEILEVSDHPNWIVDRL